MSQPALVLITTSFPIQGDGSEAAGGFVADLVEELAKHVPMRVVAPGAKCIIEHHSDRIEVFRYAAPQRPLSTLKLWRPSDLLALGRVLIAGATATRSAAQAGPTCHLLALWALPSGYWARRVSRQIGIPYSTWALGSDIWSLGRIPIVRSLLRTVLREAAACFADGVELAQDTHRIASREVEFLPSTRAISKSRSSPLKSEPPYRLLFLGRWHPNKGIDLLLEAMRLLSQRDWQRIEAVEICGGGPMEASVRQGVAILQQAGRPVQLQGYLDKEAAEATILRADYLLIPSRIESIPVVFSDAIKLGCPVVSTPTGDLPGLIEKFAVGVSASEGSAAAMAEAISVAVNSAPSQFQTGLGKLATMFSLSESIAPRLLGLALGGRG
ncbi:glycosyltransferase [Pseudomarimonas arenosa]|uniref:Glycosyltransferase n=1 Tax=Pseudomarimonas arenosa TaxID=2774145 RepID=A0AAW3ZD80_9GAMM|nr:glycosyltransferase [Pseudomarimonas arenosa]MBD8524193.1 glycosyltransferase [Pseudomarimonas arenosa]